MEISLTQNINEVKKILNHKDFNEKNFRKFSTIIKSHDTKFHFTNLLNNFYNIINIKPKPNDIKIKKFISLYTIKFYPQIMNIDKSISSSRELLKSVTLMDMIFKSILKNYDKLNLKESIILFHKKFKLYIKNFDIWKRIDIEGLIITLIINHIELEEQFNDNKLYYENMIESETSKNDNSETQREYIEYIQENLDILLKTFDEEKKSIMRKIISLDKEKGHIKFEKYYKLLKDDGIDKDTLISSVTEIVNENISINFWSEFKKDIDKEEPDFTKLEDTILELKHYIYNCIPNKKEIHLHIDNLLDLEYIKSKIVNKVFNNYDLQGYFNFIIEKLKEYQPPSFDEDTNLFEEQLKDLFLENGDLEIILAFFFGYITPKFAEIVNLRNKFFSMLNK